MAGLVRSCCLDLDDRLVSRLPRRPLPQRRDWWIPGGDRLDRGAAGHPRSARMTPPIAVLLNPSSTSYVPDERVSQVLRDHEVEATIISNATDISGEARRLV